ncbi:MAG TPA: glutamate-5-semialdehyde dehydrogenase [Candidatus Gallimonas intestinigallinarum]|uniref:Gamma-glutamyl phosphate reductase n=1 Tax=Candidatus Gallimonas intestinigallinarum TaxID=2838604 RepID=A0A9D2DWL2_9FIRM|nr:glutamate-5-semialdehyde dehydrogenase [Candidatus Gallimonas intestinigallinarum]
MTVAETCRMAKEHAAAIAFSSDADKNKMLALAADALVAHAGEIVAINAEEVAACTRGAQFQDRLMLNEARIAGIAEGLKKLIALACPVGEVIERHTTESGLDIARVRVPFGVIGIIYEARPNVTADAIGLCIKSGNAVVLRGSKDAYRTNEVIVSVIKGAIAGGGFDPEFIQLLSDCTREGAREFMRQRTLDVLIPRGSASLIQSTLENAEVPVIETGTGNCHVYVENSADLAMAQRILDNAKTQRTSVCNACESLVVDRAFAQKHLAELLAPLIQKKVELVGDAEACALVPEIKPTTEEDFYTEFLAMKLSVRIVEGVDEAIAWINEHSTHHSEAIVTRNAAAAEKFLNEVDSACVYENASTRFTDGFEFGFGAEMGISTQKLHARGPMGLRELTSYKFVVKGNGQVRK